MRVLVTGHHGYVGSVLVPMLLARGHEITGVDTFLYKGSTFGSLPEFPISTIRKDIRDLEEHDLQDFQVVIHLAGLSNDPLGDLNPELTDEINHRASVRLAELSKMTGVERFIFSSSCSNYGAAGDDWIDESSPFNPVTPYGISKVRVEEAVRNLADEEFSPVFLRSATAYGNSPRLRFDLVLNNLVAWAFTTGKVFLKSDGKAWRPLVHVEDMASAFVAALEAPRSQIHNQAFNVGRTEENYRIYELAEIVREVVPGSEVHFAEGAAPDQRNYRVRCDKIEKCLPAFAPNWDVRQGAAQLYKIYREVGLIPDDFEGPRYRRVNHIKALIEEGKLDENLRWKEKAE